MIIGVPCIVSLLGVTTPVAERVIKFALMAEFYLRNLKGDDWYDEFQTIFNSGNTALFEEGAMHVARKAESLLAMYYALPHFNTKISDDGGLLGSEWVTESGVKTERRFVSFDSVAEMQSHLLQQCKLLVDGDIRVEYSELVTTLVSSIETGSFYLGG